MLYFSKDRDTLPFVPLSSFALRCAGDQGCMAHAASSFAVFQVYARFSSALLKCLLLLKKKESREMLKKNKKQGLHSFVSQSLVSERAFLLSVTLAVLVRGTTALLH